LQANLFQQNKFLMVSKQNIQIESEHVLCRVWSFQFLPDGFFGRLMVRMLQLPHIQVKEYWRYGMMFVIHDVNVLLHMQDDVMIHHSTTQSSRSEVVDTPSHSTHPQEFKFLVFKQLEVMVCFKPNQERVLFSDMIFFHNQLWCDKHVENESHLFGV
jgi:hypothetical protein